MKKDGVSKEKLDNEIQKAKNYYKSHWPGITKYFTDENWFENEFKNIIPYWTLPLYENIDEQNFYINLSFEEIKVLEKVFIKADVVKMTYKEKIILWDDFSLDYRTIYRFKINSKNIDFSVYPKTKNDVRVYVQFLWNRLKNQVPEVKFDFEVYKIKIKEKVKKIETPYEGTLFYDYEIEILKDTTNLFLARSIGNEEVEKGMLIAINKTDNYLYHLYHPQFTEERIFGYVFAKKWILINSLKNGEIKFELVQNKKVI